ncbi:MAG: DUF899 domain-containing protein [Cyclobacteriaceae bacterium]|nr:DUF899 domain-containing protein [Cyclobacteriaceae bacterium]
MEHTVVSKEEWLNLRRDLLQQEKEFTKAREAMAALRRALPWVKIDKDYIFETVEGPKSLGELFGPHSQLIVYHFMFGPDWEEGCKSCSFWADNYNNAVIHLNQRDVHLITVSRGPLEKLQAFKKRMGWTFEWVSSAKNSFNFDFNVSFPDQDEGLYNFSMGKVGEEMPGISVFYKDEDGQVYHTYSRFARGLDLLNATYHLLDLVPKGRNEEGLPYTQAWIKLKDQY